MYKPPSAGYDQYNDSTHYRISNSLRFKGTQYLTRTFGTPTNNLKWSLSYWVKISTIGVNSRIFFSSDGTTNNQGFLGFYNGTNDAFRFYNRAAGVTNCDMTSDAKYRDTTSWVHVLFVYDSANVNGIDRSRVYINGVQQTATYSPAVLPLNTVSQWNLSGRTACIGRDTVNPYQFDGYLAEVLFLDGTALIPSDVGVRDTSTGSWVPKKYRGSLASFGNNGFYLPFSNNTSTTTLGYDYKNPARTGTPNDWTPTNMTNSLTWGTEYDWSLDSPTNNYATLNAIVVTPTKPTYSQGSLVITPSAANYCNAFSSIPVSSGKWFAAFKFNGACNSADNFFVVGETTFKLLQTTGSAYPGQYTDGYSCFLIGGNKINNSSSVAYGVGFNAGDTGMIALDLDNGKVWFGRNGTWFGSGVPETGTLPAYSGLSGTFFMGSSCYTGGCSSHSATFGAIGFPYNPPVGFKPICTSNL